MRRVVTLRLVLAGTAAAFMMLTDGATTMGAARAAQPAANPSVPVTRFQRELAHWGYVWQLGTERVTDLNQAYCKGEVYSAMWPNPQAPTIVTHMPEVQGQAPNTNSEVTWRLRQDEAAVIIGVTPPPMAYFSFDLTMMKGSLATGPLLWVSVGDPVSNRTVRTTGSAPYDRLFALVITGNRRTQDEVNTMLAAAGLGGATNNVPIPPAMFRLGLDGDSDEFFLGTRTAVPESGYEQARDEYLDAPPLTVFRVRPKSNSGDESQPVYTFDPLPVPRLRVAGTGTTELDLNPTLQLLRRRIVDSYPGYDAHDIVVERAFEESYPGLQENLLIDPPTLGVGAYSYDARYLMSPNFTLADGSFIVAYGTNHVTTGKASYASIAVYADPEAALTLKTKHHLELQGSARDFIPDQQNADSFYAWSFSRAGSSGPTGLHVTPLAATSTIFCKPYGTERHVNMSTVRFVARAYVEPATKSRPALSELLLDRLLLFTPK